MSFLDDQELARLRSFAPELEGLERMSDDELRRLIMERIMGSLSANVAQEQGPFAEPQQKTPMRPWQIMQRLHDFFVVAKLTAEVFLLGGNHYNIVTTERSSDSEETADARRRCAAMLRDWRHLIIGSLLRSNGGGNYVGACHEMIRACIAGMEVTSVNRLREQLLDERREKEGVH